MLKFQGKYIVNKDHYYKVDANGNAPQNLSVGDLVVTAGGTYLIIKVKASLTETNTVTGTVSGSSQYEAILYSDTITTKNFTGTYLNPPQSSLAFILKANENQTIKGDTIIGTGIDSLSHDFPMPDNYIYFYHLDQFIMLPLYADSVLDSMGVLFTLLTPLSRSAPIYSYLSSGPRTVQVGFDLHRDLMKDINYQKSNVPIGPPLNDDYVDVLIRYLLAAALPVYDATNKMVNPPIVAMRLGRDIFIKGVVEGSVGLTYKFPILENGKYALISLNFTIAEVDPYDAWDAANYGSYRGLDRTLELRMRV